MKISTYKYKLVPQIIIFEQQETCKSICIDTLNAIEYDSDLLERIITCAEPFLRYDSKSKR